ncbi:MAG: hypothetical protein KIS66_05015 [Fimbriimonadaceae bacterium]|nr:hypothetical protein [Fimbriimonadaceae bacterium]
MRARYVLVVAAAHLASAGLGQSLNDMMVTGDKAMMMMPPTVASEGQVEHLAWSSDGRYLVLQRAVLKLSGRRLAELMLHPPTGPTNPDEFYESRLEAYDVETGNRKTVISRPGQTSLWGAWAGGRPVYLAFVRTKPTRPDQKEGTSLLRYDAANGVSSIVWSSSTPYAETHLFLSPTLPTGFAVLRPEDGVPQAMGLDGDLRPVGSPVAFADFGARTPFSYWTEDGTRLVAVEGHMEEESRTYRQTFRTFDPRTLTSAMPKDRPKPYSPPTTLQANVVTQRLGTPRDRTFSVGLLTGGEAQGPVADRKEPDPPGVVDLEVERVEVSPTGRHVAYTHKGIAMVRELVEVPRSVYEQARNAAARVEALSKGKQCALALLMFAADNGDKLPSNKDDWAKAIEPYLKNASLLEGFVYTYGGGFMTEIGSPATQEIGYVNAPGGRAIVYADGHVRFVADGGAT